MAFGQMNYYKTESRRKTQITAILIPCVYLILVYLSLFLFDAGEMLMIVCSVSLVPLLLLCLALFLSAKDTFVKIDNDYLSWQSILSSTNNAELRLSDITAIELRSEKYPGDGPDLPEIRVTTLEGYEYVVPLFDNKIRIL